MISTSRRTEYTIKIHSEEASKGVDWVQVDDYSS